MAFTDYSGLKGAITSWVERAGDTAYTGEVDTFIDLAEAKLNRELRHHEMLKTTTLTTDANGEATLPTDFISASAIYWNNSPKVLLKSTSWARLIELNPASSSGIPFFYSVLGTTIKVSPVASGAKLEIAYYAKLTPLDDTNTTNWLIDLAPDLYLYMALAEGAAFTGNDTATQKYYTLAAGVMKQLKNISDLATYGNVQTINRATGY